MSFYAIAGMRVLSTPMIPLKARSLFGFPTQGKLSKCWQHVARTAKCLHIWPTCPCRGDTKLIPTHLLCVGVCQHLPNYSVSTKVTYLHSHVRLCRNICLLYSFSHGTFLLLSMHKLTAQCPELFQHQAAALYNICCQSIS